MTITLIRHHRPMPAGEYVPGGGATVRLIATPAEREASNVVARSIVATALYGASHHVPAAHLAEYLADAVNRAQ